jgi:Bacterial toxin 28
VPDFSVATLVTLAGSDPWALASVVTDGDPAALTSVGAVFHTAAQRADEVSRLGQTADATVASAFSNNGLPIHDATESAGLTRALLSGNGESMEEVGRLLDVVADELGTAADNSRTELSRLTDTINAIIARRNEFMALNRRTLSQPDVDAADRGFQNEAVQAVRGCADAVQRHVDGYDRVLSSRIGYLDDLGYPGTTPGQQQGGDILTTPPAPRTGTVEIFPRTYGLDPRLEGGVRFPVMPGGPEILVNVPAPPDPTATDQGQLGPGTGLPGVVADRDTGGGAGPAATGPGLPVPTGRGTPTDRVKEQVDPPTLDAARRELEGEVVARRPDGEPFDHVQKVQQGQRALVKRITQLQRQLGDTRTTDDQRPALETELSEASRLLDHTEQFVPRP